MMDRRDLLKLGAVAPLALGFPSALWAGTAGIDLWVSDSRFLDGALGHPSADATRTIDGDVTALWTERLDAEWRKAGFIVAGTTGSDALFVLEQLAWSRGRRVTLRQPLAERSDVRPALVHWVITPVHPSMKT